MHTSVRCARPSTSVHSRDMESTATRPSFFNETVSQSAVAPGSVCRRDFTHESHMIDPIDLIATIIEELEASQSRWNELKNNWMELTKRPLRWNTIAEGSEKFKSTSRLFTVLPRTEHNSKSIWGKLDAAHNIRLLNNYFSAIDRLTSTPEELSLEDILSEAHRISTLPRSDITSFRSLESALEKLRGATFLINNIDIRPLFQNERGHLAPYRFGYIVIQRIWSSCIKSDGVAVLPASLRDSIISITQQSSRVLQHLIARVRVEEPVSIISGSHTDTVGAIVRLLDNLKTTIEDDIEDLEEFFWCSEEMRDIILEKRDELTVINTFFTYEMPILEGLASDYECDLDCIRWINVLLYGNKVINDRVATVLPLINNPSTSVPIESDGWSSSTKSCPRTGGYSSGGHSRGGYSSGGHSTGGHYAGRHSTGGHSTGGHSTSGHITGGYKTRGQRGYSTGGSGQGSSTWRR